MNLQRTKGNDDELTRSFKLMGKVVGLIFLCMGLAYGLFFMVGMIGNELNVASDEIGAVEDKLVAEELGIDTKDLVKDVHLFKSYNTYYTSVGDYKVDFEYIGDMTIIKSIVKVDNANKELSK